MAPADAAALTGLAEKHDVEAVRIGETGGSDYRIRLGAEDLVRLPLDRIARAYHQGFTDWIEA